VPAVRFAGSQNGAFTGLLALAVDAFELRGRHVDLAPDLDDIRDRRPAASCGAGALQLLRERANRPGVGSDVVALNSAPAGDGAHEPAVFVGETHGHAIDLRFDDVTRSSRPKSFTSAGGRPGVRPRSTYCPDSALTGDGGRWRTLQRSSPTRSVGDSAA